MRLTLLFLLLPITLLASEPELRFLGEATLYNPSTAGPVTVVYRYTFNEDTFQGHLEITPKDSHSTVKPYSYYPEVGQQFFTRALPVYMGDILGEVVRVDWECGACSLGTSLYVINNQNEITPLFEKTSRAGFQIHWLSEGPTPQIIGGSKLDPAGESWRMDIFAYDLPSQSFILQDQRFTSAPHLYAITL